MMSRLMFGQVTKPMCNGCVILCILMTVYISSSGAAKARADQNDNVYTRQQISGHKQTGSSDGSGLSPRVPVRHGDHEGEASKQNKERGKSGKRRPVRSPQQPPDLLNPGSGGVWQNQAPKEVFGDIKPTKTMDAAAATISFQQYPGHFHQEAPESPAEQRDDELEHIMEMLRLRGYTHTVLPDNMSLYPDLMNYTEPAEGEEHEEAGEGPEAEEHEGQEAEEHEGPEEYEADEHPYMTASVNMSDPRYQGEEADEYEADEGLKPSGTQFPPHKVHNMSHLASELYDPYYNYGYQYRPKKNEPHENIQPTPVQNGPTKVKVIMAGQAPASAEGNATAGSQAKMVDVKEITRQKVADFGGLSASATFGIIVGTIIGFWLIMGPMICLVMKVRDQRKEREKRFLIGPRSSQRKSDNGIMEAMIMTELGKLPFRKEKKHFPKGSKPDRTSERMSLTDDKETETFHDAYDNIDTPKLLP